MIEVKGVTGVAPFLETGPAIYMQSLYKADVHYPIPGQPEFQKIVLRNGQMEVDIFNFGARITGVHLPGNNGLKTNIVLHYPNYEDYLQDTYYLGATIGRFAGRIRSGICKTGAVAHQLPLNDAGKHHLHGGPFGLDGHLFKVSKVQVNSTSSAVSLTTTSMAGDQGYPGNMNVTVKYTLTEQNSLIIEYFAECDQDTHINLTNHTYFNLAGAPERSLEQRLRINAEEFLETDAEHLPTGKILRVTNAGPNFRIPAEIRYQKQRLGGGMINQYFILNNDGEPAATLKDWQSGRKMDVFTSYPFLVFYSGDYLDIPFLACAGVCLEAQFAPDSPNLFSKPLSLLKTGESYRHSIVFKFSW